MIKNNLKLILTLSIFALPICCVYAGLGGWEPIEDKTYDFYYDNKYVEEPATTELQDEVDYGKEESSIMIKLLEIFWLDTHAFYWKHKFINYVRSILNMTLWLLSFIALIIVIYAFYTMLFSGDDNSFEKAKWKLIGIFIALAIVWLARLIVSFIFRWYQDNWKKNESKIGDKNTSMNYESIDNSQIYLTV